MAAEAGGVDTSQRNAELRTRAELHASRREWAQAIACFQALLRLQPDDADVLLQLSYVESLAGHYRAARAYALRAEQARPRDPAVIRELIARLRTFNAAPSLHACIDRLRPLDRVPIPLLLACAGQLSNLNEQERALSLLDEARRGDPDYPPTLLATGQVLTYLGRFEEAETLLSRCLGRAPEIARTYWLLSRMRTQREDAHHVDAIRAQLARPGRTPDDIVLLAYALHKELDDLGDHAGAWTALETACSAKRSRLTYAPAETAALVDRLIAARFRGYADAAMQSAHVPVFIIGMHRSGTTLLEQLLDGSAEVRGLGELYDFTSQMREATDHHCRGVIDPVIVERSEGLDFAAAGRGYLAGVAWRLGTERFFTDKLPSNFLNAGFICSALPQAKILHMRRDPMETCFSNLRELFSDANPYSYEQHELGAFHRQYTRLMAHWHARFPGRILDVDYAELVANPGKVMRLVAAFCGIPYEAAMSSAKDRKRAVSTASAVAVRQEVAGREISKWRAYAEQLRPLRDALDANASRPDVLP